MDGGGDGRTRAEQRGRAGVEVPHRGEEEGERGSRSSAGALRTAALASALATARIRLIQFAEVGHRLLRRAADPLLPGAGPSSPPGPFTS